MYILIGIILIIGGLFSVFYLRPKAMSKILEMQFLQTKTVKELLESFENMKLSGLENSYKEFVELKGHIVGTGIKTPFSERMVAYYKSKLLRVNEIRDQERDDKGNIKNTVRKQETLISDETSNHYIEFKDNSCDETIIIDINDPNCKFDLVKTFDRFEYDNNISRYSYFSSPSFFSRRNSYNNNLGVHPLGYRMEEKTLDINQNLYILGGAYYNAGKLHIGKPIENGKPFLVSYKSEEELINHNKRLVSLFLFGGFAASLLGLFVILSNIL